MNDAPQPPPRVSVTPDASWISIRRAAARADVSRRTIYIWLAKGLIRYVRTAGGAVRIDAASLFRTP